MEDVEFKNRVEEINQHICEKCKKRNKCVDKTQYCNAKKVLWFLGNKIAHKNVSKGNK